MRKNNRFTPESVSNIYVLSLMMLLMLLSKLQGGCKSPFLAQKKTENQITMLSIVLHGIALLDSERGLYLARHLSILFLPKFPGIFIQLLEYPIPRAPPPAASQKPSHGNILGTKRGIIDIAGVKTTRKYS